VWLDQRLLAVMQELCHHSQRVSDGALAATWASVYGSDLPFKLDTFRKCLGRVLAEHSVVQILLQRASTHGLPELDNLAEQCAACCGSQEHLKEALKRRLEALGGSGPAAQVGAAILAAATALLATPEAGEAAHGSVDTAAEPARALEAPEAGRAAPTPHAAAPAPAAAFPAAGATVLSTGPQLTLKYTGGGAVTPGPAARSGGGTAATAGATQEASVASSGLSGSDLPPRLRPSPPPPAAVGSRELLGALRAGARAFSGGALILYHSIYYDACFALCHHTKAGSAIQAVAPFQFLKALGAEVKGFVNRREAQQAGVTDTSCSEFTADTALARTSKVYDITAVGGCLCPHGSLLCFHDLFTGERWSYSTFAMQWLMKRGIFPLFWWYDINCRYRPHVQAWAQAALDVKAVSWAVAFWVAAVMRYPVPPFHISAHNAHCQAVNGCRGMKDAGTGAGEPTETIWSHFRHDGLRTQYMSHARRDLTLELRALSYNKAKESGLLGLVVRRFYLQLSRMDEATREVQAVVAAILRIEKEWGVDQAKDYLKRAGAPAAPTPAGGLTTAAQYVECFIQVELIKSTSGAALPPHLLIPSMAKGYKENGLVQRRCESTMAALRVSHPAEVAGLDSQGPEFHLALLQLSVHRFRELQAQARERFQELTLVRVIQKVMVIRRNDSKRLLRAVDRAGAKLGGLAELLVEWAQSALNAARRAGAADDAAYVLAVQEAKKVTDLGVGNADQVAALRTELKQGRFPWAGVGAEGAGLGRLAVAGRKALDELARAKEQAERCVVEVEGAAQFWGERCERLRAACGRAELLRGVPGSGDGPGDADEGMEDAESDPETVWEAGVAAMEAARAVKRAAAHVTWLTAEEGKYGAMRAQAEAVHGLLASQWREVLGAKRDKEAEEASMGAALHAALAVPGADSAEDLAGDGDDTNDDDDENDDDSV